MMIEDPKALAHAMPKKLKTKVVETSTPSLYVNHAQFSMSQWDIRVDLGEQHVVDPDPDDPETAVMSVIEKLRLIMNPGYARLFAKTLNDVLDKRIEAEKQAESEAKSVADKKPES